MPVFFLVKRGAVPAAALFGTLLAGVIAAQVGCSSRSEGESSTAGAVGYDARPANQTCKAPPRPQIGTGIKLMEPFQGATFAKPVAFMQAPNDPSRYFVVEQGGLVKTFAATGGAISVFADLHTLISVGGEDGLLNMAFHPNWPATPEVFFSYNPPGGPSGFRSTIGRFKSTDGGKTVDISTVSPVLPAFDTPYWNHKGGSLAFGKDGYLYFGFGDGGSGGDPHKNGQNVNVPLGKIHRLDVSTDPPTIPADNPFANGGGVKSIYAYGIRNPWRFSFDRENGELWLGDVGQGKYEEVDKIVKGGNYGWNSREGFHCYNADNCPNDGFIDPIAEYDHSQGVSITGGYVYRGKNVPGLAGTYLYGDYSSGKIWGIAKDGTGAYKSKVLIESSGANISSFGEDLAGEVYVVNYRGKIHKVVSDAAQATDTIPKKLSQTGCVDTSDARKVANGVIPYGVNSPLWSDGAEKERYFAIPDGTTITVKGDGDWDLPVGSVTLKTFIVGGKRVETRYFVRHEDGEWAGYTYEWNEDETDADLLPPAGKTKQVGDQTWTYPTRSQCLSCHTAPAGRTLGLETAQLNGNFKYTASLEANQIKQLNQMGYFTTPITQATDTLPALPKPTGAEQGKLEDRARAYLHSNCSHCHRSGGTGGGTMDFRFSLPFIDVRACNVAPNEGDLGVAGAKIIVPGDPAKSIISIRTHALDATRMPALGTKVVDTAGVELLDDWIRSLSSCPAPAGGGVITPIDF
jgi:uncharacterized repeat protein (TIGR03806 family)